MIGTPEEKRVSDSKCSKPRPSDVIQCHTNPCPAWKASDWNEVRISTNNYVGVLLLLAWCLFSARIDVDTACSKEP